MKTWQELIHTRREEVDVYKRQLESLEPEVRTGTSSPKEKKTGKKDSATQAGVNPANS